MRQPKPKLFTIADHDEQFKTLLIAELCHDLSYKLLAQAQNGHQLLSHIVNDTPKLAFLIIDLFMPGISGVETVKLIREVNGKLPIIAHSSLFDSNLHDQLQELQVNAYCQRNVQTIRALACHLRETSSFNDADYYKEWKERDTDWRNHQAPIPGNHNLTAVEIKLLIALCKGYTNKEIAASLNYSTRTIEDYIMKLGKKLRLASRVELINYANQSGIFYLYDSNTHLCQFALPSLPRRTQ